MSAPYPWPVKPFNRQHPVRGFFNDPRIQDASHAFHFGIDVSAPDGTAVYAVTPGQGLHRGQGPRRRRAGARRARLRLLARQAGGRPPPAGAAAPAARAHREGLGPRPLRREPQQPVPSTRSGRARSTPFVDVGHPTIAKIMFRARQADAAARPRQGPRADLLHRLRHDADPRAAAVVAHAGRSRRACATAIFCAGKCVLPLRAGRRSARVPQARRVPPRSTRPRHAQNHPNKPGLYCYILAHDWNSAAFPNDHYHLEVQAADVHGNRRQPRRSRSRSATERVGASRSGSTTTCSRWNAPIGLSLRPCTCGRRSTSWRA